MDISIDDLWDAIAAGSVATTAEVVTYAGQIMDRPPNTFVPDAEIGQPGAEVVILPPFVGPGGDQGANAYESFTPGCIRLFISE